MGRNVVLRLCRDLGREVSCHLALPMGGPPEVVKTHGQAHWGYLFPTWAVVGWKAALVLAPHLILLGTPHGSHIVGAFTPTIGRDACRCSCLTLHQSWCWYDPCWIGVHVGHPHYAAQRCMPNYHLCQWVRCFLTASSKEESCAWCGCAHTAVSLNAISPSMVLPSTIKRYAISCWGFSVSPHTPAQERAKSSDQVTSLTWNHDREGQISWDPHNIWVNSSHRLGSLEKCTVTHCRLLSVNKVSYLEGGSKQIPRGDTGQST